MDHGASKRQGAAHSPRWAAIKAASGQLDEYRTKVQPYRTKVQPHWIQAGDHTWALVLEGTIVGLVYWTGPGPGEEGGPGGDPVVTDAGWFCLSVNDPQNHDAFDGPTLTGDMSHEELAVAMDDAREIAARKLLGETGGR